MIFTRPAALILDAAMCAGMDAIQRRHRLDAASGAALEEYIVRHEPRSRDEYFGPTPSLGVSEANRAFSWQSPIVSAFPENNRAHADFYPCAAGWAAPTVLMLHALMSASDLGYRRWAADFNAQGWNAVFLHLPYHYSRRPKGHFNGELAITADLLRTAEGLRQGVTWVTPSGRRPPAARCAASSAGWASSTR